MRTVLQGTSDRLYQLQRADLPDDFDLRQSYWRYVDFSGYDLSGYDMRDMDILDSDGSGSTIPNTDWTISRRTDWAGATLTDVSSYNHDLMVEVVRQANVTGRVLEMAKAIDAAISRGYENSWQNNILHVITSLGLTIKQAIPLAKEVFQGHPRLLSRFDYHASIGLISADRPGAGIGIDTEFLVKLRENEKSRFDFFLTGTDRYIAAQAITKSYSDVEVVTHLGQLDPWPYPIVVSTSRVRPVFGWWSTAWPS